MDIDQTWYILRRVWNPIDVQGHRSKVKVTPLKDVYSRVFTRMLWKEGRKEGRMKGRKVALLYPFATSLVRG
jgi:hypothetical protein